jgi:hypothetical protein
MSTLVVQQNLSHCNLLYRMTIFPTITACLINIWWIVFIRTLVYKAFVTVGHAAIIVEYRLALTHTYDSTYATTATSPLRKTAFVLGTKKRTVSENMAKNWPIGRLLLVHFYRPAYPATYVVVMHPADGIGSCFECTAPDEWRSPDNYHST